MVLQEREGLSVWCVTTLRTREFAHNNNNNTVIKKKNVRWADSSVGPHSLGLRAWWNIRGKALLPEGGGGPKVRLERAWKDAEERLGVDCEPWKPHLSKLLWESHRSKPFSECFSGSLFPLCPVASFRFAGLIRVVLTRDLKELLQGSLVWSRRTKESAIHPPASSQWAFLSWCC